MTVTSFSARVSLLALTTILATSCAEKSQAPESLTLKMMRMQAENNYQSEIPQKDLKSVKKVQRVAFVCCAHQDQRAISHAVMPAGVARAATAASHVA